MNQGFSGGEIIMPEIEEYVGKNAPVVLIFIIEAS